MKLDGYKAKAREAVRARRGKLDPEWAGNAGASAQRLVLGLPEWKSARSVLCYLALPDEVDTDILVRACWRSGRQIFVPAFRRATGRYEPARYEGGDLVEGYGSVPEPARPEWLEGGESNPPFDSVAEEACAIALVITPGVAFDRAGNRIGHGHGHYDRLLGLRSLRDAFKVGLGFGFQMLESIPAQAHDVRMDVVVTESKVYRIRTE